MKYLNELSIVIALVAVIAAITVLVIISGPDALTPTGFHDIGLALAAGLVGVTQAPRLRRKDDDDDPPGS